MHKIGDKVSVDHPGYPGIWTIVSRGPKNSLLVPESGGRRLRVPHTMLLEPGAPLTGTDAPHVHYHVGEVVQILDGRYAGTYVVIRDTGGDKVNVAKIGGDDGRYIRALRGGLVKVDASEVVTA
jgi:hypothetical protein